MMIKILICIVMASQLIQAATSSEILTRIEDNFNKLKTLRCNFETKMTIQGQSIVRQSRMLIKGNKIKINSLNSQFQQTIICDGQFIYIDMPEFGRKDKHKLSDDNEINSIIGYDHLKYLKEASYSDIDNISDSLYQLTGFDLDKSSGSEKVFNKFIMTVDFFKGIITNIKFYNQENELVAETLIESIKISEIWITAKICTQIFNNGIQNMVSIIKYIDIEANDDLPDKLFQIPN